jgi:hypothetical protein
MAGTVGADIDQLRRLSRTFRDCADRLLSVGGETNGRLLGARWVGADADRFRGQWQRESMRYLHAAADRLHTAAMTLQRNADEQQQASAADTAGVFPGHATPTFVGSPGDPVDGFRQWLQQTPIWPISINNALGMTPAMGRFMPVVDAATLGLDGQISAEDKIPDATHSVLDFGGGSLRDLGFKSKDPALYLAGAAVSQWGDVADAVSKTDFSAGTFRQNMNYIAANPGDAFKAASDAVAGYLPKMLSNFSFNPFGK